jgi:hypothetical protein
MVLADSAISSIFFLEAANSGCKVEEQLPNYFKVKGVSRAIAAATMREKIA